jgi:CRISPR-associated protein Cas6
MSTTMATPDYWSEPPVETATPEQNSVVDLVFTTHGQQIPADHAWSLSVAVTQVLPWLKNEICAGIHLIHGAQSGNGWERPPDDGIIELSARTRFVLRLPVQRVTDGRALSGQTLELAGYRIDLLDARVRPLSPLTTVLARHVHATGRDNRETAFLEDVARWLERLSITPRKMLCGRIRKLTTPDRAVQTRSLLLAELSPGESARVQRQGLGPDRLLGCGLFMPHKSIGAVHTSRQELSD